MGTVHMFNKRFIMLWSIRSVAAGQQCKAKQVRS